MSRRSQTAVLTGEYSDHLPLYRQAEIYAREGVDLDRTLLAQWVGSTRALLAPLTEALRAHVFAADAAYIISECTVPSSTSYFGS